MIKHFPSSDRPNQFKIWFKSESQSIDFIILFRIKNQNQFTLFDSKSKIKNQNQNQNQKSQKFKS